MKKLSLILVTIAAIIAAACSSNEGEMYYTKGGVTINFGPRSKMLIAPKLDSIPYWVVSDGKVDGPADSVTVSVTLDFIRTAEKFEKGWQKMKMYNIGREGDIFGHQQIELTPDVETVKKLNSLNDFKEGDTVSVTFTTRSTRGVVDKFNHKKCFFNVNW